jgi:anti-sigma factor (TIGR02949 family)
VKPECEQVLQQLERFLDGELPEPDRVVLDRHLNGCTPCMERADFKRHVRMLLASRCGGDQAPEALHDKVIALLHGPPATPPGSSR